MCENNNGNKIIITMQELMEQMGISDKTLHRMIEEGELPEFTYGTSQWARKKGWHTAVLEHHAIERYEHSRSIQNARDTLEVAGKDMTVDHLRNRDRSMSQQQRNLDDWNTPQQQRRRKVVPKRVRSSASKSRVAAGFPNVSP